MRLIRRDDLIEELGLIHRPQPVREDFDLDVAVEPGGLDPAPDPSYINAALAHQPAVIQKIDRRSPPVADMEREKPLPSQRDAFPTFRTPPLMNDLDRDPARRMVNHLDHIGRLSRRVDG